MYLKSLTNNFPVSEELKKSVSSAINTVSDVLKNYLKKNSYSVLFYPLQKIQKLIPVEYIDDDYTNGFAHSNFKTFETLFFFNPNLKASRLRDMCFHELGHFDFIRNLKHVKDVQAFCHATDVEGGISKYADKYLKHIYGKKLREKGYYNVFEIDIKYHENYAEFFRLYYKYQIEKKPFSTYFPNSKLASYVLFLKLSLNNI